MKLFIITTLLLTLSSISAFSKSLKEEVLSARILNFDQSITHKIIESCRKSKISPLCLHQFDRSTLSERIARTYFNNKNADRKRMINVLNEVFGRNLSNEKLRECLGTFEEIIPLKDRSGTASMAKSAFEKRRIFNAAEFDHLLSKYIETHNEQVSSLLNQLTISKQIVQFDADKSKELISDVKNRLSVLTLNIKK